MAKKRQALEGGEFEKREPSKRAAIWRQRAQAAKKQLQPAVVTSNAAGN
jgi:hypothetical protein